MKKIARMVLFSGLAVYVTSLWDKGFVVSYNIEDFIKVVVIVAIGYYLIVPISKVILLPINLLTFGLMSLAVYALFFYFLSTQLHLITIKPWTVEKISFFGFSTAKINISYLGNLLLSSASVSAIIRLLEKVI